MITHLRVKNFKGLEDVEIELGPVSVLVGPNNSGKTTALQALALWEIGLRKWLEKRSAKPTPDKRPGVTINRNDLIAMPVPDSNLLWRDLQVRSVERKAGRQQTRNIRIEIIVSGISGDRPWECGFEFDYANQESLYCRPLRVQAEGAIDGRMVVPESAAELGIAFLPPMSGLAATEDFLQRGAIDVRIGEGRTAEVLRNLCFDVAQNPVEWPALVRTIENLFGVTLNRPVYMKERGQISMSYLMRGIELDLVSSGRGLQQTLLLFAHLYAHPKTVLLLDEPDAHLEILRQRQIYQLLAQTATAQNCQVIMASHSEVILNEAADRDIVIAFVGKPHRIDDRGSQAKSQVLKSLKAIGFDQYYQAEQRGWVLYLEGSTDLSMLQAFAERLNHPAKEFLSNAFVHYAGNSPPKAADHFFGLREAKPDLVGIAIYDSIGQNFSNTGPLFQLEWRQREIENYLCFNETLMAFANEAESEAGPTFEQGLRDRQFNAMSKAISDVRNALETLRKPDPFGPLIKASDEFLSPVFQNYYQRLGIQNLMQKTDFHILAKWVPLELVDPEIVEKLDQVAVVAGMAKPS